MKITRHGGASDVHDATDVDDATAAELEAVDDPPEIEPDPNPEPDGEREESDDEPDRPALNASTADWAAYAVTQGHDPETVGDLSRAELIDLYGPTGD